MLGAKRWMRIFAAGVCFLQLASTPSAAEPELVKLAISEGTAKLHLHHIYSKLNLRGRVELVRYMQRHGLD